MTPKPATKAEAHKSARTAMIQKCGRRFNSVSWCSPVIEPQWMLPRGRHALEQELFEHGWDIDRSPTQAAGMPLSQ